MRAWIRACRVAGLALRPPLFLAAAGLLAFALVAGAARALRAHDLSVWGFPFAGFGEADRYALTFAVAPLPILTGLVIWRARARYGRAWPAALGLVPPRPGPALPATILLWPAFQIGWVSGLAALSGELPAAVFRLPPALDGAAFAVWVAWLVLLAPLAEELLFRGDLFARARGVLAPGTTVLLSAGLFSLSHALGPATRPLSVLPLGLALGLLRVHTGSLFACMALHAANNGALVLVMLAFEGA
ncbi:CPBP family intramembrane glutamic endopeptidase [Methylobacterium nodulans]|uniref:Abortive infection protein n=1 Tax=Methylobacterium nodulans (strain LMG 21967 / CNCM I-2342 / ORS 2060) TaxID=460265 RepID=B8IF19_METNO|nr:CPBP family intramembrane glutamic endopeptidase [Methylobacterium nodulans]ACL55730.1 Abortive infection protein [Methylobacterium nodulans ORS 2060]